MSGKKTNTIPLRVDDRLFRGIATESINLGKCPAETVAHIVEPYFYGRATTLRAMCDNRNQSNSHDK